MLYESQYKYKNYKRVRARRYLIKESIFLRSAESFWVQNYNIANRRSNSQHIYC